MVLQKAKYINTIITVNSKQLRKQLEKKLIVRKAFWSYDKSSVVVIPDDVLIEKVLLHLDIEDVQALFYLFPKKEIKKVWQDVVLPRDPLYRNINKLYAFMFFNIEHPDRYIRYYKNKYIKSIV